MKYDTIIIGGGISGLVAGITLCSAGQKVGIVSSGQSALHFNSGSMELLGHDGRGNDVDNPCEAIKLLPPSHPYSKIGAATMAAMLADVKDFFARAGIKLCGDEHHNHYRITPMGAFRPAWLSLDGYAMFDRPAHLADGTILIVNIKGFIDFYPEFIRHALETSNYCEIREISHPKIERLRKSASEMRPTNISAVINGDVVKDIAADINTLIEQTGADAVIMPAVVGSLNGHPDAELRQRVKKPLYYAPTMPISVGGMHMQITLRQYFRSIGGDYFLGDTVSSAVIDDDGHVCSIFTDNLGDTPLEADDFILASGSFISHGLLATYEKICEPIFGLDIEAPENRADWCSPDIYSQHPYMSAGVATDNMFHPSIQGRPVRNLFAAGSVASGCDPLHEQSGAGVAILTAMFIAREILKTYHRHDI